jgi:hypothetical protein
MISSQALVLFNARQRTRNIGPSSTADMRPHRLGCRRTRSAWSALVSPELAGRCGSGRWSISGPSQPPRHAGSHLLDGFDRDRGAVGVYGFPARYRRHAVAQENTGPVLNPSGRTHELPTLLNLWIQ